MCVKIQRKNVLRDQRSWWWKGRELLTILTAFGKYRVIWFWSSCRWLKPCKQEINRSFLWLQGLNDLMDFELKVQPLFKYRQCFSHPLIDKLFDLGKFYAQIYMHEYLIAHAYIHKSFHTCILVWLVCV